MIEFALKGIEKTSRLSLHFNIVSCLVALFYWPIGSKQLLQSLADEPSFIVIMSFEAVTSLEFVRSLSKIGRE